MAAALPALAANGRAMHIFGKKKVVFELWDGQHVHIEFVVMDVRRPLLSIGQLAALGYKVHLGAKSHMEYRGKNTPIVRQGNLYYLPVRGSKGQLAWPE
eukprot:13422620-Heterocapsa_arctica.AAC.1